MQDKVIETCKTKAETQEGAGDALPVANAVIGLHAAARLRNQVQEGSGNSNEALLIVSKEVLNFFHRNRMWTVNPFHNHPRKSFSCLPKK